MGDRVKCHLEVYKAHIEWSLVLACLVYQYSEIHDSVSYPPPSRNPACSSAISISIFIRILFRMIRRRILLACETKTLLFCNA